MSTNQSKIITKPPNRGFQLRKPPKTTPEQDKQLRDQLHIEIENKTKACSNISYDCTLSRVDGYDFCLKHILQDPRAPYKQCSYIYTVSGKRCLQPAPKYDPKRDVGFTNFCFEHSRRTQLTKTRIAIGKLKRVETTETLLSNLSHYVKTDKIHNNSIIKHEADVDVISPNLDPFLEINSTAINEKGRNILDYASDSSSDEDPPTISNTWRGHEMDNSDNESVDSQNEDLLKHAGIYTTEEATMITKEKLIRLQALYIEQFQRLQHVLKEKRRKYLHALRRERETLSSIHSQPLETMREKRLYDKLKALNQYHRRHGVEAVLYKKLLDKRSKAAEGIPPKAPFHSKCMFTEGGVKCGEKSLPCCKFCKKHILEDKKQVLFRACGVEKSGVVCQEPVPNTFDDATCVLHIDLPPPRTYALKKYESDSDEDDSPISSAVKREELKNENPIEEQISESKLDVEMYTAPEEPGTNITICHDEDIVEIPAEEHINNFTIPVVESTLSEEINVDIP